MFVSLFLRATLNIHVERGVMWCIL